MKYVETVNIHSRYIKCDLFFTFIFFSCKPLLGWNKKYCWATFQEIETAERFKLDSRTFPCTEEPLVVYDYLLIVIVVPMIKIINTCTLFFCCSIINGVH